MQARILSSGFFILLSLSCLSPAQTASPAKPISPNSRHAKAPAKTSSGAKLLSADDGLAILGAALEGRYKTESHSDCSHLVHAIYEKAGFSYKYEKSTDLYAGVEEFRRVTDPQPGDLIVWPGHAGIVVSPMQHTFYSALRSGFGMQPYDSAYWKRRGRPHFFRYAKAGPQTVLASNRTPALKPTGLHAESDADDDLSDHRSSDAQSREGHSSTLKTELSEREPAPDDPSAEAPDPAPLPTLPKTVVVYATRLKADQISNALREQFQAFADTLETRDLLALQPAVMSFDRLDVQKLQLKGNKGSAQLRLYGAVALAQEGRGSQDARHSKERSDMLRLELHHANGGWEVVLPANAIYLPRQTVVRILAHQLAALTDDSQPDDSQPDDSKSPQSRDGHQVQLARWLNVLLEPR
jgi:NlpC/P60 family protein